MVPGTGGGGGCLSTWVGTPEAHPVAPGEAVSAAVEGREGAHGGHSLLSGTLETGGGMKPRGPRRTGREAGRSAVHVSRNDRKPLRGQDHQCPGRGLGGGC